MNQEPNPNSQSAAASHETAPEQAPLSPRKALVGVAVVLLILLRARGRRHPSPIACRHVLAAAHRRAGRAHGRSSLPPKPARRRRRFVLPGNVTAYTDSPIYARTDGYLAHWYFDIGAKVKKGALLAVIATPELDQQVAQAEADLATAEANANNARIQAERYSGLVKSNAVSQQDTDTFVNQAAATASAVKSAQANLQRLRGIAIVREGLCALRRRGHGARQSTPASFIRSAGRRHGALPHAGAPDPARLHQRAAALLANREARHEGRPHLSRVPRQDLRGHPGPHRRRHRPVSRTLLVEIDVDNRAGELMPGSLAQVHFKTAACRRKRSSCPPRR